MVLDEPLNLEDEGQSFLRNAENSSTKCYIAEDWDPQIHRFQSMRTLIY
jgi:hypothetical protein